MASEKKKTDPLEAQLQALLNQVNDLNENVEPVAKPAEKQEPSGFDGVLSQADLDELLRQAAEEAIDSPEAASPEPPPAEGKTSPPPPPAPEPSEPAPTVMKRPSEASIGQDDIDALLNATESLKQELTEAQKPTPTKPGALTAKDIQLSDAERGTGSELDDGLADDEPSPPKPKAPAPPKPANKPPAKPAASQAPAPPVDIPKELDIDLDAETQLAEAAGRTDDLDQAIAQAGVAGSSADDLDVAAEDDALADAEISEAFARISDVPAEDLASAAAARAARRATRHSAMPTPVRWLMTALAGVDYAFSWIPMSVKNLLGLYAVATLLLGMGLWVLVWTRDNSTPLFTTRLTTLPAVQHKDATHDDAHTLHDGADVPGDAPAHSEPHDNAAPAHDADDSSTLPAHDSPSHESAAPKHNDSSLHDTSPSENTTSEDSASPSHEPASTKEH